MSSTIQIKFLSLDEMANARDIDWRYEHVGIDNLGFADKAKNRVFVRAGLEPQLQTLLIDHELSHLFEMEGTDEDEFGIRHKKKGGFMKVFLPIALAIGGALIGGPAGSAIFGSLGSLAGAGGAALGSGILGSAAGTGIGTMLGGVTGSSLTGKPSWPENAMSGLASGAASGVGSWLGNLGTTTAPGGTITTTSGPGVYGGGTNAAGQAMRYGTPIFGSGIAGLGKEATQQGLGMIMNGPSGAGMGSYSGVPSGWSDQVAMPQQGGNIGSISMPSSTGVADMGGLAKMPMNPGLGQAGITLGSQQGQVNPQSNIGFDNMFQGQEMDPIGFNNSNGGQFAF